MVTGREGALSHWGLPAGYCVMLAEPVVPRKRGHSHPSAFIIRTLTYAHPCEHAQSLLSCLTLYDPMDSSLPSSSVHGTLQARILEWVAMPSSRGVFPAQGLNPSLLHCRQILYPLSHLGSPSTPIMHQNSPAFSFSNKTPCVSGFIGKESK